MNQSPKPATVGEPAAGWEQRLRAHPEVLPQIAVLLDSIELKHAATATADQAETGGRVAVQQLGQERAARVGRAAPSPTGGAIPSRHPGGATPHPKKLTWHTIPPARDAVALTEQRLRLGRRGAVQRPFCEQAHVQPRRRRAAPTKPRPRRCATVSVSCARGGRNWTTPARWRPASRLAPD